MYHRCKKACVRPNDSDILMAVQWEVLGPTLVAKYKYSDLGTLLGNYVDDQYRSLCRVSFYIS